jgi:hypothetical protein
MIRFYICAGYQYSPHLYFGKIGRQARKRAGRIALAILRDAGCPWECR